MLFVECGYCVRSHHLIKPGPDIIPLRSQSENDQSAYLSARKLKTSCFSFQTEDEGNHGNDDTRCFILSTLASQGRSKVHCVLCEEKLPVFDRYPLVDGTFFLSPRQHAKGCIEVIRRSKHDYYVIQLFFFDRLQVKVEGRTQFLTVVCMACLEGVNGRAIICRFCNQRWDGSSLVLGTMYSYDIFAAMPCCTERIKVKKYIRLDWLLFKIMKKAFDFGIFIFVFGVTVIHPMVPK